MKSILPSFLTKYTESFLIAPRRISASAIDKCELVNENNVNKYTYIWRYTYVHTQYIWTFYIYIYIYIYIYVCTDVFTVNMIILMKYYRIIRMLIDLIRYIIC